MVAEGLYDNTINGIATITFAVCTALAGLFLFYFMNQRKGSSVSNDSNWYTFRDVYSTIFTIALSLTFLLNYIIMWIGQASVPRDDSVEVIYSRWVCYTFAFVFFTVIAITFVYDSTSENVTPGGGIAVVIALGLIFAVAPFLGFSTVSTGDRRWFWVAVAAIFTVVVFLILFFVLWRRQAKSKSPWHWVWWSVATIVFILYHVLVIIGVGGHASDGFDDYTTENWMYFVYDVILVILAFVACWVAYKERKFIRTS